MQNFNVSIKHSQKLLVFLFLLHIVTLISVFIYFSGKYLYCVVTIFFFSLFLSIYANSEFYTNWISRIDFLVNDKKIQVYCKNRLYDNVKIAKQIYVTPYIIIIKLIIANKTYHQLILPDMVNSKEESHFLLLALKWGLYNK